jgi:stringent starvation protein B
MDETPTKPYLIRALHEWCVDNGYTPYISVHVDARARVPRGHVRDGQITLNVSALATNKLVLGNDAIEFQARFGGVTEHIVVPVDAVNAIYARETGAGMGFDTQPYAPGEGDAAAAGADPASADAGAAGKPGANGGSRPDSGDGKPPGKGGKSKRPKLTIVK